MTAHTPGPWHYRPHAVDSNYMLIFCSGDQHEGDNLRGYCGEANARLIAAAPELLAALKDVMRSCRRDFTADAQGECDFRNAYSEQIAAIAKAEGRA